MIAKLFTTLTLILTLLFQNFAVLPARRTDDLRLKAVLISDIHADADPTRDRTDSMRRIFAAIGRTQRDADTVVMSGDLTNSGDLREYINLNNCLNLYCRIPDRVPEMGNHDSWHHSDDPDYEKALLNFRGFCRMNGISADRAYYRTDVNGIAFLVMGAEDCDFGDMAISEAQFRWLEEELEDACLYGRPVFVICHKPLRSLDEKQAERLDGILTLYAHWARAPVVCVSGHRHEIGENTFSRPARNLVYLNLPSLLDTEPGGMGFVAEIADTWISFTGMDFITGEELEGHWYYLEY
jgi:hypothetical protein